MTRYLITLNSEVERTRALRAISAAPLGTRLELKAMRRSLPQNDRMWAMLTDVSLQASHAGRRFTPDQWKIIFMSACGREVQFLPALEGAGFIPWGQSSSDLSKEEMSNMIEFMFAWGAQNGVTFHDDKLAEAKAA